MQLKALKPLQETKYLSVENAWRYRAIMRTFYVNDMRYKHWLNKEDVFEALKGETPFSDYTLELCAQDLEALNGWGNLNAVQDTSKVMTYQQFVTKQFRYQMTAYAIEIERMTVQLEKLHIEGGSLEPTLMERLKTQIEAMPRMLEADDITIGGWWNALTGDFQRLNQSYQDYIRDWSGAKAEELLKTKQFLIYKEKLVEYLRYFIKALQLHGHEIALFLRSVSESQKNRLFERVTGYEMEIPRVDMERLNRDEIYQNIKGKYDSLEHFFIGSASRESELQMIMTMTNEIIRRITRYAANILEQINQYSGRKEEYKTLIQLFSKAQHVDEAHLLAAQVFGVSRYCHFVADHVRETENIQSSIYEEAPIEVVLTPRIRTFREKIKKTAIVENSEKKAIKREEILKAREAERQLLIGYIASGRLDVSEIGLVHPSVRRSILKWIQKGILHPKEWSVTEHGHRYRIENPNEMRDCELVSEDGVMTLPAYVLVFEVN